MPRTIPSPVGSLLAVALLAVVACERGGAQTPPVERGDVSSIPDVAVVPAFPKLDLFRPVFLTHAGDGSNRLFVIEQRGRIRILTDPAAKKAKTFLEIPQVRMRHNEEGLLGLAFHPRYAETGEFFVYYTASGPRRGVLSRYRVSADDPDRADRRSEEVLLEVEQPWGNHNGATCLFGPDGYLYLSLGDGGAANDPNGAGQDLTTLLGTVVRIDVEKRDGDRPYAVPADNPFVGHPEHPDARPEIWAYGLRNVWRMSFDRATGDLWGGDVGQDRFEEIDLIVRGGNYGWNIREGSHPFQPAETAATLIDPVVEYGRKLGISVTGGYVYRGTKYPRLRGVYLYGDYQTGRIWGLRWENGAVAAHRQVRAPGEPLHIASFGEDADGEIYVCAFDSTTGRKGRIWRIVGPHLR